MTTWRVDHTTPGWERPSKQEVVTMHMVCVACGHSSSTDHTAEPERCKACNNGFVVLVNARKLAAIRKMREGRDA